ncbi:MAG: AraC family transcriptional regulator [Pseudomonadota bacterium]
MTNQLFVLPLPIITFVVSVVTAVLVSRVNFGSRWAHHAFTIFLAVVALGSLLVGLRFGYGVEALLPLQRIVPFLVGPLLYVGFRAFTLPPERMMGVAAPHFAIAFLVPVSVQFFPLPLPAQDWLIGASSLIYGLLLMWHWTRGLDHLSFARLEMLPGLRGWLLAASLFLIGSCLADVAISWAFSQARADSALQIISAGSLVILLSLVAVAMVVVRSGGATSAPEKSVVDTAGEANQIVEAAEQLLLETQLYLDTDLTVERLAKRLRVPVRTLSSAVNQREGINVPQWVNGFRLCHAAGLLLSDTASVASVMEKSGFLTRSNFYREFKRAYEVSPAEYRSQAAQTDDRNR